MQPGDGKLSGEGRRFVPDAQLAFTKRDFSSGQHGFFPTVAGEKKDLTPLCRLKKALQRKAGPPVVKGVQDVVQQDGAGVPLRKRHIAHGKPHRQVELLGGSPGKEK